MMQLDLSSLSIIPSERPQKPEEAPTYMDSSLFNAAEDGDMELFNKYQGDLHCLVDGRRNTALHIYSRTGGPQVLKTDRMFLCFWETRFEREFSIYFVKQLLDECPSLLLQPNARGEIPLHIAVRHGHSKIVEFLIERAKIVQHEDVEKGTSSEATSSMLRQMLRMKDKEENTAFHEAVISGNVDMLRLLVKELDPDFLFSTNKNGETPLYIAAKRPGDHLLVAAIMDHFKSMDYGGPDGTTALHAAVMDPRNDVTVRKLIAAKKELTKETDDKGRTPLHHAVCFSSRSAAKLLLEADASAAYITDKKRGISALHMAAWRGNRRIMEDIISYCPGCSEIVDKRGWNFLHFAAVTSNPGGIMSFLCRYKYKLKDLPIRKLLDEKDINGNTPLHVLIFGPPNYFGYLLVFRRFSSLGSDGSVCHGKSDSETKKKQIQEALKDIANNAEEVGKIIDFHMYVKEMVLGEEENIPQQHKIINKARETHLLVATLVATVTFAAAFQVPGGYKNEQGTATLSHDTAFKTFVITDASAFISSLLAIFIHLFFVLLAKRDHYLLVLLLILADWLTFFAMVAMVAAFSAATYIVLKSALGVALATSSFGLIFLPALLGVMLFTSLLTLF